MQTVFDWGAIAIFAGLVVLFLQRSSDLGPPRDRIWQYAAPALGCAIANFIGNRALESSDVKLEVFAVVVLVLVVIYVLHVLRPFQAG